MVAVFVKLCCVGVDSGATGNNGVYSIVCLHSAIPELLCQHTRDCCINKFPVTINYHVN